MLRPLEIRHSETMEDLKNFRAKNPHTEFEARPLQCSDGTFRLVVMPLWYWHRLEVLLMVKDKSLEEITEFCLALADTAVSAEGWEHDIAFRELLMYYIYRNFQYYKHEQDNLANDNWDDCFAHA